MSNVARTRQRSSGRWQLATDGESYREYDPALVGTILGEAAHLLRHLGFAVEHIVLIGGVTRVS